MTSTQSPFPNEEYTVGWICALSVELAAAKGMMDEVHGEPQTPPADADNNSYVLGSMGKFKVVAARLPMHQVGSSSATAVAKEMLFTFPKIRVGLLVGIGAGIPDYENDVDIRLGDVVIGTSPMTGGVVVYDFGKSLADGSFESLSILNRPPRSLASAVGNLQTAHEMQECKIAGYIEKMLERYPIMRKKGYCNPGQSADRLFQSDYLHSAGKSCNTCAPSAEINREPRLDDGPVIHYGTIASGNTVVKNAQTRDFIRDRHGAICLEMEAAGLMNNFPCIVIRGISDYADSHKHDRWQPFAAATAAACAKELLEHVQPKVIEAEPAAKDMLCQVQDNVVQIKEFVLTKSSQEVLDWITKVDFNHQHNDNLQQRLSGTGNWFVGSDEFDRWMRQPQQTLFCPGIPGAGKTIMSSIVIEHLKSKFVNDPEVQICYLFCSYQASKRQTTLQFLLSLLRQLAVKGTVILPNIKKAHDNFKPAGRTLDLKEAQTELSRAAQSFRRVFVVIDALDEYCSSHPEDVQELLSALFAFQEKDSANILATSRPNSEIMCRFQECIRLEIRAQDEDILAYVDSQLPTLLRSRISLYPEVHDHIRCDLLKNSDGMFLLARLHMEHLKGFPTVGDLEEALAQLPKGRTGLGEAYDQAIDRIKSQSKACSQLAFKVLSLLTFCKLPLKAEGIQYALATQPGKDVLDRRFLPDIGVVDSVCAALVVMDQHTRVIRLVHYTTREYLLGHRSLVNSEEYIARTCIAYLSLVSFTGPPLENRRILPDSFYDDLPLQSRYIPTYSFGHYSGIFWAEHALAAMEESESVAALVIAFLDNEKVVHYAVKTMKLLHESRIDDKTNWLHHLAKDWAKIHLAAHCGLSSVIREYARRGLDLNVRDSNCRTPLVYAAASGQVGSTRVLLESGSVDPDAEDDRSCMSLHLAAREGYKEIVQLLFQFGSRPSNENLFEALCAAIESSDLETVRVILDHGAEINQLSTCSNSPAEYNKSP
ncbi:hypothetical protein BJY00DRAFT_324866 [Aspergillus carlsbadensis]|nr:hypothetical protein BJY00DRAFT_324866 [Aspergillus carlsbadensis]